MTAALANYLPFSSEGEPFGQFRGSSEFLRFGPTPVFEAFWSFAAERQAVFFRRLSQSEPPWTVDPILGAFKFTNVYRASDRVSQYLIRNVIYKGRQDSLEVVFRILLFKLFNKIETWQLLENHLGEITTASFSAESVHKALSAALDAGRRIYSAAYIMPSGSHSFPGPRKHWAHLRLLELMLKDNLHSKILEYKDMEQVFMALRSYPMLGDFLAYQYAIDINYSEVINFSESEFVMPGPGARNGLQKCFTALGKMNHGDVIRLVTDLQEAEFERRGIQFQWLGNRRLQLIDVQNLFCEIDKYARVRFPDTTTPSKRSKIKQRFRPNPAKIDYWYPPKWGIRGVSSIPGAK